MTTTAMEGWQLADVPGVLRTHNCGLGVPQEPLEKKGGFVLGFGSCVGL